MINGDTIRSQRNRLFDGFAPTLPRFAYHAGDEIDVDLREVQRLYPRRAPIDFFREVRPAVFGEDFVVHILHTEAETSYADGLDCLQFFLGEGAGLALKRDFLRLIPRHHRFHSSYQRFQVVNADIRRRAAAEIDEFQRAICDGGLCTIKFNLLR